MIRFSDLNFQIKDIKKEIFKSISLTINKTAFVGGDNIKKFENNFKKLHHAKYCLAVGNGTDALEIAIESLNLKKNSEVMVPVNTWISTAEAVVRNNLKVKFIDIDKNTNLISIKDIKDKINNNTSAIIPVHLYGQPCEMNEIKKIAKKHNLKIIEDCAQAHLAEYNKKKVGNFGNISCFSFFPGKNLGAMGDAGAILTNSKKLYIKCKMIANHGGLKKNSHLIIGRNSRLDNIQAGVLNVKLKKINQWTNKRINNAKFYIRFLKNNKNVTLPIYNSNQIKHVYHLFVIKVQNRSKLMKYLKKNKIQTNIHYPKILTSVPAFQKYDKKNLVPNAKKNSSKILSLPVGEHLNFTDIKKISLLINKFYNQRSE